MMMRTVRVSLETALYIALLGLMVWAVGRPFIFPSLGPTAFGLARPQQRNTARRVLGGHLCGVLSGLLVYHSFASGLVVTTVHAPFSTNSLWLAVSGALSVALTAAGMLLTRTVHSPACATTLIISLGLLSSVIEGGIIMAAVTVLYGTHRLLRGASEGAFF